MAQLDKFLHFLGQPGVRELRLASGEPPVFHTDEGPRPASSARPGHEQLMALIGEVVGSGTLDDLRRNGTATLDIDRSDAPPSTALLSLTDGAVVAVFRPRAVAGAAAGTAAAAAVFPDAMPPAAPVDTPLPAAMQVAMTNATQGATPVATPVAMTNATTAPSGVPGACVAAGVTVPTAQHTAPATTAPTGTAAAAALPAGLAPPARERGATATTVEIPRAMPSAGAPPIDRLFRALVARQGSDLHLSSGEKPMLRVDGEMVRLEDEPALTPEALAGFLAPITPERNREEFGETHDTDFAYEIADLARFRCNVFRDRKGPGAVFRIIPSKILTAEQLGLSPHILELCRLTKGLVLVTGPTGSGKSTTLTALIDHINTIRHDHIITIEDPIEFVHENRNCLINQREVSTHTGSFKRALRAALREDPDILLVGEMRDLETVAIAIETAETGHLVFGTLHTTTAVSTVDRIIDQFPADQQAQVRTMLSEALKGVIAQVLCKKQGGGRVAALEVLIGIPSVANLIREGKTFQIPSLMQTGRKHGMVTLNDSLIDLARRNLITPDEAFVRAVDKAGITAQLKSLTG